MNPDHCPNFEKASKMMENFLKVIVLYQTHDVTLSEYEDGSQKSCVLFVALPLN